MSDNSTNTPAAVWENLRVLCVYATNRIARALMELEDGCIPPVAPIAARICEMSQLLEMLTSVTVETAKSEGRGVVRIEP